MGFEEGLVRTIGWYRENRAWIEHMKSEYRQYYERNDENRGRELVTR